MEDQAVLRSHKGYTIFEYDGHIIRFVTSSKLERYTRILIL